MLCFQSETASSPEEKLSSDESAATVGATSDEGAPKFKSALLQQMLGNKGRLGRSTDKLSESKSNSEEEVDRGSDKEVEIEQVVPEVLDSEVLSQAAVKVEFDVEQAGDDQRPAVEEPDLVLDREAEGSIQPALEETEVRTDEAEYSEEKPVIQLNDIVVEDDNQQQADTERAVGSNQDIVSNVAQPADSKDSVGNGDCVGLTDNIATGNWEPSVSVATTPSSNCAGVADADSKESLRDGLEQDKDIDTTESNGDAWRVDNNTAVRVDASPDGGGVRDGRVEQNGFTRCDDDSDPMLQLDSK